MDALVLACDGLCLCRVLATGAVLASPLTPTFAENVALEGVILFAMEGEEAETEEVSPLMDDVWRGGGRGRPNLFDVEVGRTDNAVAIL